jgi:hypothetical protein
MEANFVCVAEISRVYESLFVSARLIRVVSGAITASAERYKEVEGMTELTELADGLVEGLIYGMAECNKKDQPVDKKGCCEGLVAVDGICKDRQEILSSCGIKEVAPNDLGPFTAGNTIMTIAEFNILGQCHDGWRVPNEAEMSCLLKILDVQRHYWVSDERKEYYQIDKRTYGYRSYRSYVGKSSGELIYHDDSGFRRASIQGYVRCVK